MFKIPFEFDGNEAVNQYGPPLKYAIVIISPQLRQGTEYVPVVIASTKTRELRSFEHELGTDDGFDHETVVDGRWIFTISATKLIPSAYKFRLLKPQMKEIITTLCRSLAQSHNSY